MAHLCPIVHNVMAHQAQVNAVLDGFDEGVDTFAAARLVRNNMMGTVDHVVQLVAAVRAPPALAIKRFLFGLLSEVVAPHGDHSPTQLVRKPNRNTVTTWLTLPQPL